jgi:tRNA-dihydrouridine synthase B
MIKILGENFGVREMRKHLCWYTKGLHGGAEFRTRINLLPSADEVKREISGYFASVQESAVAAQQA